MSKVQTLLNLKDFMDRAVQKDSPEEEKILEQLDDIWYSMTAEEQEDCRKQLGQKQRELN